jgi:hypothetical protein
MTSTADISVLYQEFTEALTEVLRKTRLAPLGADGLPGLALPSKSIPNIPSTSILLQWRLHSRNGKPSKTWDVRTGHAALPFVSKLTITPQHGNPTGKPTMRWCDGLLAGSTSRERGLQSTRERIPQPQRVRDV